jgi:signal transduction histidine kinase/FixJ family two-component response regulator
MVAIFPTAEATPLRPSALFTTGELVAVVDDSPDNVLLLSHYLSREGFDVVQAGDASEFRELLSTSNIALVLLDIDLPDKNGDEILRDIVPLFPDLGIIMVTSTVDIEVALACLRLGADDYLTKPISAKEFNHAVITTLQKRRLVMDSRAHQEKLHISNSRLRFLQRLNLKMNSAYLNTLELKNVLKTVLVGITADDGLKFNRAILALFDDKHQILRGELAIVASAHEKAPSGSSVQGRQKHADHLLKNISSDHVSVSDQLNRAIKELCVSVEDHHHILIKAIARKKPILIQHGFAKACRVPEDLLKLLGESIFVAIPLYSPSQDFGVIIVDNYLSREPINHSDIHDLEIFASQASLIIEHSHLYKEMAEQITRLEQLTSELENNRQLLIDAEKQSTIGRMSSQLLHSIRNPLTSIGATSRLLAKKAQDPHSKKFLQIIVEETSKIEKTLDDLFSYVVDTRVTIQPCSIYALIREMVMVFSAGMREKSIHCRLSLAGADPLLPLDENKIRQLFLQLIRNSIEAMPDGGTLTISAQKTEQLLSITIMDTGHGIPVENLHHLTDPFFSTKTRGNGMGLALVKQIVSAHRGSFSIANNPEGGVLATLKLPLSVTQQRDSRPGEGQQ